ncbi:N-acetylmuramoyl-L-alanine amidase [Lactococcus insecticola]|uniref:N-acetylmuramoyl-L-alanine amidase n=1 Tax=Pseudolactococcus insecticola TaxID=2709158 RepID=A0A6A0B4U9_9LACT|nr:N-acetylmuramoyl-L-alanine amidase [Lactococcus insecticola]GFH40222.1 hypothetical protein Hs20B_06200 [Lactococcus insecticola]
MSISTLASPFGFQSFPHFTAGRSGAKIDKIVIHHMATTNFDSVPSIWQTRQASAHYGIGKNGEIHAYVDENNTAWHAGNWNANISSIGIEHCNSTGSPAWGINQATIDASAKLCADIAKRQGLGQLVPYKNIFPHSHFSATACPGQLLNKLQYIADKANAINNSTPAPIAPSSVLYRVRKTWADVKSQKGAFKDLANAKKCADSNKGYSVFDGNGKSVYTSSTSAPTPQPVKPDLTAIAKQVIAGNFGNGADRKRNLEAKGYNYDQVQAKVNELLGSTPVSKPAVDLNAIADAVIRGDYGNGDTRRQRIIAAGYDYNAVQALVNKKLG